MELDEATAILLELLRTGKAGAYGYDLFARTGAENAVGRMANLQPYEDQGLIMRRQGIPGPSRRRR